MPYSSYDHDKLEAAETMRIERRIYFEAKDREIAPYASLPIAQLLSMRSESAAAEQAIFDDLKEPPPRSWEERHFWNPGLLPFRKAAFRRESDILPPVLSHPASLFTVCITLPFCSRSAALFRLFNRCPSRPTGQAPSRRAETARRCRRN